MTHIVQAWSFAPAAVRDPRLPEKPAEVVIDSSFGVATAVGSGEEGTLSLPKRVHRLSVDAAPFSKREAHGHKQVFVELAISDSQRALFYIHIAYGQAKRFRYAEPASVEHSIEHREDKVAMRAVRHG